MANHYHRRCPHLAYRDGMSPVEADLLLASIASLEAATLGPATVAEKEIAAALVEQSLDYFNRQHRGRSVMTKEQRSLALAAAVCFVGSFCLVLAFLASMQ